MKVKKLLGAAFAVGLGLAVISTATVADAQGKGKPKKETPAAPAAEPPTTKNPIVLIPAGIAWGMSTKQVATAIDKLIDAAFKPIYQKTSPGVKMKALDAQVAEEKSAFRRSRIDFNALPTGIDATPLKGEYTYLNKESMLTLEREDVDQKTQAKTKVKTHFFFIQDKLWKVIDERTLGEGNPRGKDFTEAVTKLAVVYGAGRVLQADYDKGRNSTEVDWKDSATHLRAVERMGGSAYAIVLEDNLTLGNLASLRPNKPADENAIDPDVAAVTRKGDAPAPPPAPPGKQKR